ncbi:MAG: DUF3786 domain-containing protein [Desulfobacterales bacterium]
MANHYTKIILENLENLYQKLPDNLDQALSARKSGKVYFFRAFGKSCRISPDGIYLDEEKQTGVLGILISLYALYPNFEPCILQPFKAFKEFPDTMPYVGAFSTHTEQILVSKVHLIKAFRKKIIEQLDGQNAPGKIPGDFSMLLYPLPKIALCYIFYEADDDFEAGVTCLYSNNASIFMPVDGLADVGEYTSKTILRIIEQED